jgi:hypothetical protein
MEDQKEVKKFVFEFTLADVNTILVALQDLPYRNSNPLITQIINAYEQQNKPVESDKVLKVKKSEKAAE